MREQRDLRGPALLGLRVSAGAFAVCVALAVVFDALLVLLRVFSGRRPLRNQSLPAFDLPKCLYCFSCSVCAAFVAVFHVCDAAVAAFVDLVSVFFLCCCCLVLFVFLLHCFFCFVCCCCFFVLLFLLFVLCCWLCAAFASAFTLAALDLPKCQEQFFN